MSALYQKKKKKKKNLVSVRFLKNVITFEIYGVFLLKSRALLLLRVELDYFGLYDV